ncbi:MAG: MFS transporter [Victivallales bacterium]|nr:MFS transporter [Victivallales bacterium]
MMNNGNERRGLTTCTSLMSLVAFAITANLLAAVGKQMGEQFGMREAVFVQWAYPVQFFSFSVMCFLGGVTSDRIGKRKSLLAACVLISIGCLVMLLAPKFWVVCIAALIVGMGGGGIESISSAGLTDLHPTKSKLFMNLAQIFYCIGANSASVAAGILIGCGISWRWLYFGTCLLGAALVVCFVFSKFPYKASESATDTNGGVQRVAELLPNIWLPSLGLFLYVFAETSIYAFGPNYLKQLGATDKISTLSIAAFWTAVAIGRLLCSFLPQKQTYETAICGMMTTAGILLIGQVFAQNWQSAIVLMTLTGLACAGAWPMVVSMVTVRNIKYSGTASGFTIGCGAVGCILSPMVLGKIFDTGRTHLAYTLLGICFLLSSLCIALTYFQHKRRMAREAEHGETA